MLVDQLNVLLEKCIAMLVQQLDQHQTISSISQLKAAKGDSLSHANC